MKIFLRIGFALLFLLNTTIISKGADDDIEVTGVITTVSDDGLSGTFHEDLTGNEMIFTVTNPDLEVRVGEQIIFWLPSAERENYYCGGVIISYPPVQIPGHSGYFYWAVFTNVNCNLRLDVGNAFSSTTQVFPNPSNDRINIQFSSKADENYSISLMDYTGRILLVKEIKTVNGLNTQILEISSFANGIYSVILSNSDGREIKKIMLE